MKTIFRSPLLHLHNDILRNARLAGGIAVVLAIFFAVVGSRAQMPAPTRGTLSAR
jgi:hypothetical protein